MKITVDYFSGRKVIAIKFKYDPVLIAEIKETFMTAKFKRSVPKWWYLPYSPFSAYCLADKYGMDALDEECQQLVMDWVSRIEANKVKDDWRGVKGGIYLND